MTKEIAIPEEIVMNKIYYIRGQKVMLDSDLANLYEVETKALKQAVRRNLKRFPEDFMFVLTKEEYDSLRSQIVALKQGQHSKYLPFAFTEQGVAMLSSVLRSDQAIKVNIQIVRIFVRIREMISDTMDLKLEVEEIKKKIYKQGKSVELLFNYLDELIEKQEEKPRRKKGYKQ